jgi:hypothetical protein
MALITLSEAPDAPIDGFDETKLQPNTATAFIATVFSSIDRVTAEAGTPNNFDINNLDYSGPQNNQPYQRRRPQRGFLRGRRPYFGLLFPRGYYNR